MNSPVIPTKIISSVARCPLSPRQVENEFMQLIDGGAKIKIAGTARRDPVQLLSKGLKPKHKIELFGTRFYLTNARQIPELRFMVAYVILPADTSRIVVYPRIFYKDLSLSWRSASHFCGTHGTIWIGKGDVRTEIKDGYETTESVEATSDLPLEMQTALENLLHWTKRPSSGAGILGQILHESKVERVAPYRDFVEPRERAASNPRNLINRNRSIAKFSRASDPTSLKIKNGYEPDFSTGIIEKSKSRSTFYGGELQRFRILSVNRAIQYVFIAGPKHVWLFPPQATTIELSSYGVRTIDVVADENLSIPGFEYHHYERTKRGMELYSQIPDGFAGEICEFDEAKADALPWLDKIPLIRQFRREVLDQKIK